jgi:hypothetical protein
LDDEKYIPQTLSFKRPMVVKSIVFGIILKKAWNQCQREALRILDTLEKTSTYLHADEKFPDFHLFKVG